MVVVIDILLTMFVFWVLLSPDLFTMDGTFHTVQIQQPGHAPDHPHTVSAGLYPLHRFRPPALSGCLPGFGLPIGLHGRDFHCRAAGICLPCQPRWHPRTLPYFFYDFDRVGTQSLLYIGAMVLFFCCSAMGCIG